MSTRLSRLPLLFVLTACASLQPIGGPSNNGNATLSAAQSSPAPTPAPTAPPPPTEPPQRVAVLNIRPAEASSEALTRTMAELIAYELEDSLRFKVLSSADLAEALKLKGIQQGLGCESESCQADLAKAVDVPRFVTGSLGKMGDKFVLLLKLVDSKEATVVKQSRDFAAGREEELLAAAHRTSWELAGLSVPRPVDATNTATPTNPEDDRFGRIASAGAAGALQGAFKGLTDGLTSGMGAVGAAIAPKLTADLEASLAKALAEKLNQLRALRPPRLP